MTDIFLLTVDGKKLQLPPFTSWELKRTRNVPCDSFEGVCPWDAGLMPELERIHRIIVEEDGARRFTGVLDEYDLTWDEEGGRLEISGRGLAALLLDNESPAMDYQVATLSDILRDHVAPYGITVAKTAPLPAVPNFSVATGSSRWQVLYQFARYHGGVEPTFDVEGRLTVAPTEGKKWTVGPKTGVTAISFRDKRYGVWSEVLVQNRKTQTSQRMVNAPFAAQGLQCARVLTVPGKSGYQAMRWTGQYQLDRSAEERFRLELTLPGLVPQQPGDAVELCLERPKLSGSYMVLETRTTMNSRGTLTHLTLGRQQATLPDQKRQKPTPDDKTSRKRKSDNKRQQTTTDDKIPRKWEFPKGGNHMFLGKRQRGEAQSPQALTGPATLPGGSAVWLEGERRGVRIYAPGGYHWAPGRGEEVLVLKTGEAGEPPCALGMASDPKDLRPGEVLITGTDCALKLGLDGKLTLTGKVAVQGELRVNGYAVALIPDSKEEDD